jgi:hypothetical protein
MSDVVDPPAGLLTLGQAAARVAERRRWPMSRAQAAIAKAIGVGALIMLGADYTALTPTEEDRLDFDRSEVQRAGVIIALDPDLGNARPLYPRAFVDVDEFDAWLDPASPVAIANAAPAPGVPAADRSRGGRPASYDWPAVELQARRRVYQHGLPERPAILVAEVVPLFGRSPPEQRTIERKIAEWWPQLVALVQMLADLAEPCAIRPVNNHRQN